MRKLTIGFSPCPNDTFIFDALVNGRIDAGDLEFEARLEDVETLNKMALKGELDVTKLSFHAYAYVSGEYILLDAGSALGKGCGPLLISREAFDIQEIRGKKIVVPGRYTTANFLFRLACPDAGDVEYCVFSEIEDRVLDGRADAGVIIHENRFTYEQKGLHCMLDLGRYWEETTGALIPLGGIAIRRSLAEDIQQTVNTLIRESIQFARNDPRPGSQYIKTHAQEMEEGVMRRHIDLYVNEFSLTLGEEGRSALSVLFEKAESSGIIPAIRRPYLIP